MLRFITIVDLGGVGRDRGAEYFGKIAPEAEEFMAFERRDGVESIAGSDTHHSHRVGRGNAFVGRGG